MKLVSIKNLLDMRTLVFCLLLAVSAFMSNLGCAQVIEAKVNGKVMLQMGNISDVNKESNEAQEKRITVSGIVTCQGEPVNGATVEIKGSSQGGAHTNINGEYKVSIPEDGAVLVFSMFTLKTTYIGVKGQSVINVVMQEEPQKYDNSTTAPLTKNMTVVTGYVTSGGEPVIGAYVRVKGKKIGTFTKWNGKYSIIAPKNSTLVYSFVDETTKVKIKGKSRIDVQLSGTMVIDDRIFNRYVKKARKSKN